MGTPSMKISTSKCNPFWWVVIAAFTNLVFQPLAYADLVSTEQLVAQATVDSKKIEIMSLLEREEIRTQLVGLGVDINDAQSRINSMTEVELNQMYAGLDTLPAGGDGLGIVLTLLLIFLILDLAGVTDIFPGV